MHTENHRSLGVPEGVRIVGLHYGTQLYIEDTTFVDIVDQFLL